MLIGQNCHKNALLRVAMFGIAVSMLTGPAWSQATSAGAVKKPAVTAGTSAAADAVAADGPATLLIKKKKKKVVVTTPAEPPPPAPAAATAAADQPPVPLEGAKAAEPVAAATVAAAPAATAADSAPAADAAAATDPAAAETAKTMKKITKKVAAKPAAVADPAAKTARKAASVSPDTPPGGPTGCRTRSFLVNDYGKDGPTADAKRLLDADIASWAKANNLANIKVGPKSVTCEQFLNFIVFDEWTCTASAKVCWQ